MAVQGPKQDRDVRPISGQRAGQVVFLSRGKPQACWLRQNPQGVQLALQAIIAALIGMGVGVQQLLAADITAALAFDGLGALGMRSLFTARQPCVLRSQRQIYACAQNIIDSNLRQSHLAQQAMLLQFHNIHDPEGVWLTHSELAARLGMPAPRPEARPNCSAPSDSAPGPLMQQQRRQSSASEAHLSRSSSSAAGPELVEAAKRVFTQRAPGASSHYRAFCLVAAASGDGQVSAVRNIPMSRVRR